MDNPYKDAQLYIGVDPGPKVLGLVVYAVKPGETLGTVILADGNADPIRARQVIAALAADRPIVVLEHTHPGPPSWAVIHTTVMLGRIWEYASIQEVQVFPATLTAPSGAASASCTATTLRPCTLPMRGACMVCQGMPGRPLLLFCSTFTSTTIPSSKRTKPHDCQPH
jgi:hypothetical protein